MSARLWRHLCWSPLRAGGRKILGAPTTDRGMGRGRLGSRMSDRLAGSAVSLRQSLFHLPAFRTLVLNFTPPHILPMSDKETRRGRPWSLCPSLGSCSFFCSAPRKSMWTSRAVAILKGSLGVGRVGGAPAASRTRVSSCTSCWSGLRSHAS